MIMMIIISKTLENWYLATNLGEKFLEAFTTLLLCMLFRYSRHGVSTITQIQASFLHTYLHVPAYELTVIVITYVPEIVK